MRWEYVKKRSDEVKTGSKKVTEVVGWGRGWVGVWWVRAGEGGVGGEGGVM